MCQPRRAPCHVDVTTSLRTSSEDLLWKTLHKNRSAAVVGLPALDLAQRRVVSHSWSGLASPKLYRNRSSSHADWRRLCGQLPAVRDGIAELVLVQPREIPKRTPCRPFCPDSVTGNLVPFRSLELRHSSQAMSGGGGRWFIRMLWAVPLTLRQKQCAASVRSPLPYVSGSSCYMAVKRRVRTV
jgi:hypothetical protein